MTKVIGGARENLRRIRVATDIARVEIRGAGVKSLEGLGQFPQIRRVVFDKARTDALDELRLLPDLVSLDIFSPITATDWASLVELRTLETLIVDLADGADARAAAVAPLGRLKALQSFDLAAPEGADLGVDVDAVWLPTLPELTSVSFVRLGIADRATDAVCRARSLRSLTFRERSPAQTSRIVAALGRSVVDTWEPPSRRHGEIDEIDGRYCTTLGFPGFESGADQEAHARRLFAGKWRDLAGELTIDPGGDEIFFLSDRREPLEDLVRRARKDGLL